ncbi:MAG TPA: hypothetical protein VJ783_07080 [Pirellulales bacterium]|nr:hypothetical protein [Pirellulales bacterium]
MIGAQPQPGANKAALRCDRFGRGLAVALILLLISPLTGCLLPLASDLGLAHSLIHHHLFKPVLPELPTSDDPAADAEGLMDRPTDDVTQ